MPVVVRRDPVTGQPKRVFVVDGSETPEQKAFLGNPPVGSVVDLAGLGEPPPSPAPPPLDPSGVAPGLPVFNPVTGQEEVRVPGAGGEPVIVPSVVTELQQNRPAPVSSFAELAKERAAGSLSALEELRLAGIPATRRKAFTPFARRGFGASGLAKRGVSEALGKREAQFARERERIRSEALARAVTETLAQEEIKALRGS